MAVPGIKGKGLRVLILKIYWPDLHFSPLNEENVTPFHSSIVRFVLIDTIQVALSTAIVPPGSLYVHICCTVNNLIFVVILIFCREFMAIMISKPISRRGSLKYNRNQDKIKYFSVTR